MSILRNDIQDIPKTLIQMRRDLNWTKKDLADALGVRPDQIIRWEKSNYSTISFKRLLKVFIILESANKHQQIT
jgi:transcriptional regulator with XRE-family HTH domain